MTAAEVNRVPAQEVGEVEVRDRNGFGLEFDQSGLEAVEVPVAGKDGEVRIPAKLPSATRSGFAPIRRLRRQGVQPRRKTRRPGRPSAGTGRGACASKKGL
jgi:hypothetical protein